MWTESGVFKLQIIKTQIQGIIQQMHDSVVSKQLSPKNARLIISNLVDLDSDGIESEEELMIIEFINQLTEMENDN